MNKHIAVIFVILISLTSTTLFAQSSGINDNINNDIIELSTKMSVNPVKSSPTFSIGAGYAGTASKLKRPDGFDIQLDLIFPIATYLAINGSLNIAAFPKYQTTKFYGYPDGDLLFDHGGLTNITLSPGISFGNFRKNDKFNYFVNAGFAIGLGTTGEYSVTRISDGEILNHSNGGLPLEIIGILTSGRISYKISKQFQIYLEPGYYTVWSDDADSYYHINGGISINL